MVTRVALLVAALCLAMVRGAEDGKTSIGDIFNNDSDFMRGFETGLFLRSKGGSLEEYACELPEDVKTSEKQAFDMIRQNLQLAKTVASLDPSVEEAVDMIDEFLDSLYMFIVILSSEGRAKLDQYCTGLVFGLQGSLMLVKIANTFGEDSAV